MKVLISYIQFLADRRKLDRDIRVYLLTKRYERKFIVPVTLKHSIINLISDNPGNFSEIYKDRQINNIYLDTLDFNFLKDNINGNSMRKKVRIRWYGNLYGNVQPILEIKIKSGLVGTKKSFKLPKMNINKDLDIQDFRNILKSVELPQNILSEVILLDFTLLNSYSRRYFLSSCKKIRLTYDSNLRYFNIRNYNNFSLYSVKDASHIIELKYKKQEDNMVSEITNSFPFRLSRNSKYVNGFNLIRSIS